jgi:hypothetical protein
MLAIHPVVMYHYKCKPIKPQGMKTSSGSCAEHSCSASKPYEYGNNKRMLLAPVKKTDKQPINLSKLFHS